MKIFCSPFTVIPSEVIEDMQMEIIELQCDCNLREKLVLFAEIFLTYLSHDYLKLKDLDAMLREYSP